MLCSTRGVTKYLMRAGARVTLKAFLQTLSTRSRLSSTSQTDVQVIVPTRPTFQRENSILLATSVTSDPLPCHSIPSPLLSGMLFSRLFLFPIPLVSRQRCPGQSGGSVCKVVPDLFILCGETGYWDLLCVSWSPFQACV